MLNLERIGLGRKKKGYFPDRKIRDQRQDGLKNNPYIKSLIIFIFLAIIIVFLPGSSFRDFTYKLGEPWREDDLNAPFTFSLLKDKEEIQQAADQIRVGNPPIYYNDIQSINRVENKTDSLFRKLTPVIESYLTFIRSKMSTEDDVYTDSIQFVRAKDMYPVTLSENTWNTILENYARLNIRQYKPELPRPNRFVGIDIRLMIDRVVMDLFADGIIDHAKSTITANEIILRDDSDRTQRILGISTVRDTEEAYAVAQNRFIREFDENIAMAAYEFFRLIISPNYIKNVEETEMAIQEAIASISPTKGAITTGQVIIRKGDLITAEKLNMLQSL